MFPFWWRHHVCNTLLSFTTFLLTQSAFTNVSTKCYTEGVDIGVDLTLFFTVTCPRCSIKTAFPGMEISTRKIRRSWYRLIFIMVIFIPVKRHLYMETVPCWRFHCTWSAWDSHTSIHRGGWRIYASPNGCVIGWGIGLLPVRPSHYQTECLWSKYTNFLSKKCIWKSSVIWRAVFGLNILTEFEDVELKSQSCGATS